MRFTFVRHGSTQWNALRRFQGHVDIPLDEQGRAQAQALASLLRDEDFDYAVSSDLSRAYDTACIISGTLPVTRDPRWREFSFGEWEGLTWEQMCEQHPELAEHGATAAKRYTPPGGESFPAVCGRVSESLRELRAGGYEHVLIVTHAGPLHAMLHVLFGDREAEMTEVFGVRFSPASVTRIAVAEDGLAKLLSLNEVAHLATD